MRIFERLRQTEEFIRDNPRTAQRERDLLKERLAKELVRRLEPNEAVGIHYTERKKPSSEDRTILFECSLEVVDVDDIHRLRGLRSPDVDRYEDVHARAEHLKRMMDIGVLTPKAKKKVVAVVGEPVDDLEG